MIRLLTIDEQNLVCGGETDAGCIDQSPPPTLQDLIRDATNPPSLGDLISR